MKASVNFDEEKVAQGLYGLVRPISSAKTLILPLVSRIDKSSSVYGAICKATIDALILITSQSEKLQSWLVNEIVSDLKLF